MKSLRIILIATLLVYLGSAVWGEKPKKPRFYAGTYKMTAKIHLKDEYRMYDSAVSILEEGLQFFPDDAEMHFLLGKAYCYTGNYRGMGEQFAMADSLESQAKWRNELDSLRNEKWRQIYNQGVEAYKKQDFDTALEKFQTCTIIDPSDARSFWLFGDTYRVKGQYEEAITILEAGLKLDPDNPQILRSYGDVLFYAGRQEEALKNYEKVLEKDPKNMDLLFNVATLYYNAGDYDQAISNFQKLVAQDSTYKDAYFNLGNAYWLKAVPIEKALDSLKDKSGEYRKDERSRAKIEQLTQKKNEFLTSAQTAFERVLELDTTDLEARALLADVYQEQEDFDRAVIILELLVQKDSTNCKAWQQLAFIYAKKNVGEKASQAFQKAQDCFASQK